jgi:hypothetical protein
MQPSTLIHSMRFGLFVCVATFIVGGPFYVQVLGHHTMWLRGWQMYSATASDWCFVHYYRYAGDGARVPLVRLETLGVQSGTPGWYEERQIRTREQAESEGRRLCRRLGANAHVGFAMKCGDGKRAWQVLEEDSGDVCAP